MTVQVSGEFYKGMVLEVLRERVRDGVRQVKVSYQSAGVTISQWVRADRVQPLNRTKPKIV
jgi:hypothetical protein